MLLRELNSSNINPFIILLEKRHDFIVSELKNVSSMVDLPITKLIDNTCLIFQSNLLEFYNIATEYYDDCQQQDNTENEKIGFNLVEDIITQFINTIELILLKPSKKKTKKRTNKIQIRKDVINPHQCVFSIVNTLNIYKDIKGLKKLLGDLEKFINNITEALVQHAISDLVKQVKNLNYLEIVDMITTRVHYCILSDVEQLIYNTSSNWNNVILILKKDFRIYQRFISAGLECLSTQLEILAKETKLQGTKKEILQLLLLHLVTEARISSLERILFDIFGENNDRSQYKIYEDLSLEIENNLVSNYRTEKIKIYKQILKNNVAYTPTDNECLEIGNFAKEILLQMVQDHSQIYRYVPKKLNQILSEFISSILSSLHTYITKHSKKLQKNNKLSIQVRSQTL